jgi:hypothetical protein
LLSLHPLSTLYTQVAVVPKSAIHSDIASINPTINKQSLITINLSNGGETFSLCHQHSFIKPLQPISSPGAKNPFHRFYQQTNKPHSHFKRNSVLLNPKAK